MATSLQRQLSALADPSSSLLVPDRRRASIIFTPSEAAKYDRETFYQIGLDGLKELDNLNPKLFSKYFDSVIFDEKSKTLERAISSKEENKALDEVIEEFLIALSPYMMLKAPLKCMEWLVNRFHIEQFNVDAVLKCILPYYDTKTFTLVVKVLEVEKAKNLTQWLWLVPSIKTGTPVTKSALFSNANSTFVQWLFGTLDKFMEIHEGHPENLSTYLAFLTSTVLGILNNFKETATKSLKNSRRKVVVTVISTRIHELLKSLKANEALRQNENLQSTVYMIITMLMILRKEAPDCAGVFEGTPIMILLLETFTPALQKNAILLVNLIASVNEWNGLPLNDEELRCKVLEAIRELSEEMDVYFAARAALTTLWLNNTIKISEIWEYVGDIQMTPNQRADLIKNMFNSYWVRYESKDRKEKRRLRDRLALSEFIRDFERQYPVEFSLANDSDRDFSKKIAKLAKNSNIAELASHSESELRRSTLRKLFSQARKEYKSTRMGTNERLYVKDRNKFAKKIIERFDDDDVEVIEILMKQKVILLKKMFSLKTLVAGYIKVLRKRPSVKCTKLAIKRLCRVAVALTEKHERLRTKILTVMIPFLFPLKSNDIKFVKILLGTDFARTHDFFKEFVGVGHNPEAEAKEICQLAYETMNRLEPQLDTKHWMNEFQTSGNMLDAFMATIALRTEEDARHLFSEVENAKLNCYSSYPVDAEKIHKQLKLCVKSQQLSLELVFTGLSRTDLQDKELLQRVFTFALISSEREDCRDVSSKFLLNLLKKSFKRSSALLEFWMNMILHHRQEPDPHKAEYLLIRSLQFLASIFGKLAVTAVKDDDEDGEKSGVKAVLQPIIEQTSTPARNTRRSVRGRMAPVELPVTPRNTRSRAESSESDCSAKVRKSEEYRKEASDLVELLLTQCVQHDSAMVRHWGLECMKMLLEWQHLEQVWRDLIVYVLRFRAAIESDRRQVAAAVSRLLSEKTSTKIHDRFVQIGTDVEKLELIRFGFLELCSGVTVSVFDKLASHIRPIIEKDPSSPVLAAYLSAYDGSVKDPELIRECLKHKETAKKILSKLNQSVYEKLDLNSKKLLFRIMIDVSSKCDSAEIRVGVQRTVRKWILDTAVIESELEVCLAIQRKQVSSAALANQQQQKGRKSVSFNLIEDGKVDASVDWVRRTETVLEFVQSGKRLNRKTKLIQPLFKILKICLEMEEQTPVEYLKQLMLTALTISCEDEEHNEDIQSNLNDWVHFQVDSVIDCLRISRNPQTHHHALILLNYAAKRFPEQVLHGVMSLFTFMGNSILRQDDSYSTQLIQQTVATIIPTLASTSGARQYSRSLISAGIYRVFTSAVQDIPVHRRVPIFSSLVEVLDPVESMWQMCFIIIDNALMGQNKRNILRSDLELAREILWQFPPAAILKTLEKMYIYMAELPIYDRKRNEDFTRVQSAQNAWSKSVVDLTRKHSIREAQLLINFCLELIAKAVSKFENIEERSALDFESLLEKCLSFTRLLSSLSEDKTFRLISNRNFEVIEKVNMALEPVEFVRTVGIILGKYDAGIKKKTLDILNQRIIQRIEWFGDPAILAELIPALLACCEFEEDDQGEFVSLVQTAFLSLKLLARHLALKLPENFIPVFEKSYTHARNKNPLLAASALLCLAELFCLKSLILPKLNNVTKSILKAFKISPVVAGAEVGSDLEEEDEAKNSGKGSGASMGAYLLVVSGMTTLSKFVENLGTFVGSSFLQKSLVAILSIQSAFFGEGEKADNRKKVFEQKLKGLTKTVATKIPLRNSLASIKKTFSKLIHNPQALVVVVRLLKDSLVSTEKSDFNAILPSLFDTYLNDLLPYRDQVNSEEQTESTPVEPKDVEMVEDSVVESLVTGIVLKLAEGTFRPFYHRVFEWATDSLHRQITFYRFSVHAAERLKSLFVTFAGYVITKAGESLSENVELTRAILQFFYHIFSNDREGFVTTERFNLLVKPIVDLIESDWVISGEISIKDLNSTIIQLAVATNDLNRWQHLVELLAGKSQHKDSRVRLFTISSLEAIANELEKDFLPLLPPAVPFLADLLGDDDEKVEAETKKMLVKLEAIVGEPLQPYFST